MALNYLFSNPFFYGWRSRHIGCFSEASRHGSCRDSHCSDQIPQRSDQGLYAMGQKWRWYSGTLGWHWWCWSCCLCTTIFTISRTRRDSSIVFLMSGTSVSLTLIDSLFSSGLTATFISYFSFMKTKSTAAILAIFVGWIGWHMFYLWKPIPGILMLLFCWTFIPSFIALIQFFIFLAMSEKDFNRLYNPKK